MSGASNAPAPAPGTMSVYPVRILPGVDVTSFLENYVRLNRLHAAFIISCVGSVKSVTLRFATNAQGKESILDITENMEICALSGTVSQEGFHLHGTFGNAVGGTVSGHIVRDMVVQTTAEVMLGNAVGWKFKREFDYGTGFRELKVVAQIPEDIPIDGSYPSDDDIRNFVQSIMEGANLEQITMKTICIQVYENYPNHDLANKKDLIKETIKSLISR